MITETRAGHVYWLDFDQFNFQVPEMVKRRMVAVLTSWTLDQKRNLVTVVPLSSTPPREADARHVVPLAKDYPWVKYMDEEATQLWAKCDMIHTVSISRLLQVQRVHPSNRFGIGGNRKDPTPRLSSQDMRNMKLAVAHAVGLEELIVEEANAAYLQYHRERLKKLLPRLFKRTKP